VGRINNFPFLPFRRGQWRKSTPIKYSTTGIHIAQKTFSETCSLVIANARKGGRPVIVLGRRESNHAQESLILGGQKMPR